MADTGKIIAIVKALGVDNERLVHEEATEWLNEHITNPDSPPLDRSLSSSSSAAPADMVGSLSSAFTLIDGAVYYEDPTNQIGEYVLGYWSNGVYTSSVSYQSRKITIPENAKRIKVSTVQQYYDYYDFLDGNNSVISYKRNMESVGSEQIADIPSGAVYVILTGYTASQAQSRTLYFSYFVNDILYDTNAQVHEISEQVENHSSDISELQAMEIEGYEKSQYLDVTNEGTLYERKLAEMNSGHINISANNSYKYCVLDVQPGETYKCTGVNVFDMRPLIYTDSNGTIISYVPTTRVTTAEIVTVELTVPAGAAKLYCNSTINGALQILKKGVYYVLPESEDANMITVTINTANELDTVIETKRGNMFRQRIEVFNNINQPNSAVLPRSVEVYVNNEWKTIVNNEDDNCPVNLSSGYIGAGHGYDRARKITCANHGKTYADIGSKWTYDTNKSAWIVRIIDEDNLIMLGGNTSGDYDTNSFSATSFTHADGAVHTESINGTKNEQYLLAPVDKNHIKKVMLDGITEVSTNGEYKAKSFVDIVEEYDVINPRSIVSEILANKPVGGYTENPTINTGSTFLHFSNIYRIMDDGTMLLFSTIDNDVNAKITYWGGTQLAQKSSMSAFGGGLYAYIPKLLEVNSVDMRIPQSLSSWNTTIDANSQYWEDANNPPDRLLQLFTDGNNDFVAGYAVGYLPIAHGSASIRKTNISNAITFYKTKKAYFHLVDNGGTNGNDWYAYTPFQCIVYRKPIMDVGNVHTDAYFVPNGAECYLYADYHAVADDRIKVPAEYVGKPMTVVEKSDNVTVYGTIATDEIRIRCISASPMYGYAVVKIGE